MDAMKQTTKTVRSPSGEAIAIDSNENGVDQTKFEKIWLRQLDFDKVDEKENQRVRQDGSDYSYEGEEGDDEEDYNNNRVPTKLAKDEQQLKAGTLHKKFACKLRLYDTPYTPKTLIMNQSRHSEEELMKSPKHSPMAMRSNQQSQQKQNKNESINGCASKTPKRLDFEFLSRYDADESDNIRHVNRALHFDDSDTENSRNKDDEEISFKSHQSRISSSDGKLHVMKTPAMAERGMAIHASINPFTPPNAKPVSTSHSVNLVRVAAANYVKQNSDAAAAAANNTIETLEPVFISEPGSARVPIRKCLVSRYHQEFHEVCKLGAGEFGDVFKCINRLDGCTYAIKRSKQAIAGSALEIAAWKEVCAHAVLVRHNHIVQYYSAWAEKDRMLIQSEYCNGGSLAEFLDAMKLQMSAGSILSSSSSPPSSNLLSPPSPSSYSTSSTSSSSFPLMMNESDLKTLLLHVAKGLSYMHSLHLAHLDIKPGNIFICRTPRRHLHQQSQTPATNSDGSSLILNEESGIESDDLDDSFEIQSMISSSVVGGETKSIFPDLITYKIGDLGHVTSTLHENPYIEEGDCRYLPNELLQENFSWLVKADIFALALTVYTAGSLDELPKNGDEWHWIRQGNLKDLPQCSDKLKKLLLQMIHSDPAQRPSASTLVHHPCICPDSKKSKAQLRKELNHERFKNEILQRKVKKYEQMIHKLSSPLNSMCILESSRRTSPQQTRLTRSFSSSP